MTPSRAESWPDIADLELLRAGLRDGQEAISSWQRWQERGAPLEPAVRRLLPLVYVNLSRLGADPETLRWLKPAFERSAARCRRLVSAAGVALDALDAAGIPVILLKGVALAHAAYPTPGARPMFDLDVMVPELRVAEAVERLSAAGWRPSAAASAPRLVAERHAVPLRDPNGQFLDLHWRLFDSDFADGTDLWAAAVPMMIEARQTRVLHPVHGLAHVCVHGLQWSAVSSCRWVADAAWLLRRAAIGFEWERFVEEARRQRLGPTLGAALAFLDREGFAPIPPGLASRLQALPTPRLERLDQRARQRAPQLRSPLLLLGLHATSYARLRRRGALGSGLDGWRRFARLTWGSELGRLPRQLASRGVRRLCDLLAWRLGGAAARAQR